MKNYWPVGLLAAGVTSLAVFVPNQDIVEKINTPQAITTQPLVEGNGDPPKWADSLVNRLNVLTDSVKDLESNVRTLQKQTGSLMAASIKPVPVPPANKFTRTPITRTYKTEVVGSPRDKIIKPQYTNNEEPQKEITPPIPDQEAQIQSNCAGVTTTLQSSTYAIPSGKVLSNGYTESYELRPYTGVQAVNIGGTIRYVDTDRPMIRSSNCNGTYSLRPPSSQFSSYQSQSNTFGGN